MWKKTADDMEPVSNPISSPSSTQRQPVGEQAVIGSSLIVKGDVHGEEDLIIQGQIEGKIVLKNNSVTVGRNGRIKADVYGKVIIIEGTVQGNLYGDEKIVVKQSGDVRGNLVAPRINLEEGAKFKGSIDMEANETADKQRSLPSTPSSTKSTPTELEKSTSSGQPKSLPTNK
jgi:cytoskeletal protein CcmA (bactofilin family)